MILDRDLPRLLPGQRRQHVVVHGRAARAHPEQRDGGGVAAIVGDVLLDPPEVWEDIQNVRIYGGRRFFLFAMSFSD